MPSGNLIMSHTLIPYLLSLQNNHQKVLLVPSICHLRRNLTNLCISSAYHNTKDIVTAQKMLLTIVISISSNCISICNDSVACWSLCLPSSVLHLLPLNGFKRHLYLKRE